MSVNKYNSTTGNLERLDGYTVDSTPTSGSGNPVSSGGVFTALEGKLEIQELDSHTDDDLKSINASGLYFGLNSTVNGMEFLIHKEYGTGAAQYSFVFGWDGTYYIRARLRNSGGAWYTWRETTGTTE